MTGHAGAQRLPPGNWKMPEEASLSREEVIGLAMTPTLTEGNMEHALAALPERTCHEPQEGDQTGLVTRR